MDLFDLSKVGCIYYKINGEYCIKWFSIAKFTYNAIQSVSLGNTHF